MGFGDDLLITSYASKIKKKLPDNQIVIGNLSKKQAMHSIVYDNNPNIADCRNLDPKKPIFIIDYHPNNRPYIDYQNSTNVKYVWNNNFKPVPGEIYFSEVKPKIFKGWKDEIEEADSIISEAKNYWKIKNKYEFNKIIFLENSSIKLNHKNFDIKHKNKDWGRDNWVNLINRIKDDYLIIQSVHSQTEKIDGVFSPNNVNFRLACAILDKCDFYLGLEGGFGHVAGALKKRAVVYFGGWISPQVIGYDFHENIYFQDVNSPCGEYRKICKHCEEARRKITVSYVESRIRSIL